MYFSQYSCYTENRQDCRAVTSLFSCLPFLGSSSAVVYTMGMWPSTYMPCMHTRRGWHTHKHTHLHVCTPTRTHTHARTHTYPHTNTCMPAGTHTLMHTHKHMHAYKHIQTHTHTSTHIHSHSDCYCGCFLLSQSDQTDNSALSQSRPQDTTLAKGEEEITKIYWVYGFVYSNQAMTHHWL